MDRLPGSSGARGGIRVSADDARGADMPAEERCSDRDGHCRLFPDAGWSHHRLGREQHLLQPITVGYRAGRSRARPEYCVEDGSDVFAGCDSGRVPPRRHQCLQRGQSEQHPVTEHPVTGDLTGYMY